MSRGTYLPIVAAAVFAAAFLLTAAEAQQILEQLHSAEGGS